MCDVHREGSTFHHNLQFKSISTLYTLYPYMLRKSAAHQKKVDSAVRVLQTTTGVKVPWAMILAGFLKSDITNETVPQQVRRRLALTLCHDRTRHDQTLLVAIIVPPVAVVVLPVALTNAMS